MQRRQSVPALLGLALLFPLSSQALNSYIGVLGPSLGYSIDSRSTRGDSYILGNRFESVNIENNISLVLNGFLGFGFSISNITDVSSVDDASASSTVYAYFGAILRYEDLLLKVGDFDNPTGLYWGLGAGAYYGIAMSFSSGGDEITLSTDDLSQARSRSMNVEPVVNFFMKFLLDFNGKFGMYPFFDYELIPMRVYFNADYTDKKTKHRFFAGLGIAFEI